MFLFFTILSYLIPAIIAMLIMSLLEKYNFYNKFKCFKNSNKCNFIKCFLTIFIYIAYIASVIYGMIGGIYIAKLFMNRYILKGFLITFISIIADIILFSGTDNF